MTWIYIQRLKDRKIDRTRKRTLVVVLTLLELDVSSATFVLIEIGTAASPATSTCVVATIGSGVGEVFVLDAFSTSSWLSTVSWFESECPRSLSMNLPINVLFSAPYSLSPRRYERFASSSLVDLISKSLPLTAIEVFPLSSDTTTATVSPISLAPTAAL